jgi:hypothetical protein
VLSQNKEIAELVKILMDSTCTYAAMHIGNEKNRFAYVRAMSRCLNLCMGPACKGNTQRMQVELLKLRKEVPKTFVRRFEWFSNTKGYYMLGIHQALQVVESISVRFEKGYSSSDVFFMRSILGSHIHED